MELQLRAMEQNVMQSRTNPPIIASTIAMSEVAFDYTDMMSSLTLAFGVASDHSLQDKLRIVSGAGDQQPFLVSQQQSRAWLEIRDGQMVKVHRRRIDGLPYVDLDETLEQYPNLADALQRSAFDISVTGGATRLLEPLFGTLSRQQFRRLREWSPLLEHLAYRSATRVATFLDNLRPQIASTLQQNSASPRQKSAVRAYWSGMHMMANMFLLASDPAAAPWLSEMANHFAWKVWTPTFPLIRERTVWLAACAARSAVAFGEGVVDKYLHTLASAEHSMKAFDALYGVTAIALARPGSALQIAREIRLLKGMLADRDAPDLAYFERAYDDALEVIARWGEGEQSSGPEISSLGWRANSEKGLATRAALCRDPASITPSRRLLGFAVLPAAIATSPDDFFPVTAGTSRDLAIPDAEVVNVIARAWGLGREDGKAGATLH